MKLFNKFKPTDEVMKYRIDDDFTLYNSKKRIVNAIRVFPKNFDNFRDSDQLREIDSFSSLIQRLPLKEIQIFKTDEGADLDSFMVQFDMMIESFDINNPEDRRKINQLSEEKLELQQSILRRDIIDKYFYIIYTEKDISSSLDSEAVMTRILEEEGFEYQSLGRFEILMILYKYLNPIRSQYSALPKFSFGSDLSMKNIVNMDSYSLASNQLLDDYIVSDGVYHKMLYIQGLPEEPAAGWLASFSGIDELDYSIHISNTNIGDITKAYDKSKTALRMDSESQHLKSSDLKILQRKYLAIDAQQNKIAAGMKVYEVFMSMRIKAYTLEDLRWKEEKIKEIAGPKGYLLRQGFGEQNALFEATAPVGNFLFKDTQYCKYVTADTIGWGYPFIHESLVDPNMPIRLGKTFSNGIVLLDTTTWNDDRPNSNEFITGVTGAGKTFLLMHLINSRYNRGEKQFIIDVVGKELVKLTKDLNGIVVDSSSNQNSMINPLQIRLDIEESTAEDEDTSNIEYEKIYPLALHLFFLRAFMKLHVGDIQDKDIIVRYVDDLLTDFYGEWNINLETPASELLKLENTDYPVFDDFYKYVIKRYEQSGKGDYGRVPKERLESLIVFIKGLAVGADSTIFNGHTNVDLDAADTFNFDISKLQGRDDGVLAAQYYNIISFVWGYVTTHKRVAFKRIYADEVHSMLDPDLPDLSKWMRKISKENRKFLCGLSCATQELADALEGDSSKQGKSILSNSTYQIFLMADNDTRNTLEAQNAYDKEDLDFLELKAKRGEALLKYGHSKMRIRIDVGYLEDYYKSLQAS